MVGNKGFGIVKSRLNHADAIEYCGKFGASLGIYSTQAEKDAVDQIMRKFINVHSNLLTFF